MLKDISTLGAIATEAGCHFNVWAPDRPSVLLVFEDKEGKELTHYSLAKVKDGYFSAFIESAKAGQLYRYKFESGGNLYADPVSNYQPYGPNGPSQIIDITDFEWSDQSWSGIKPSDHIIYEMHVGTFTNEGTWRAAAEELSELKKLGITTVEMMPIADFTGRYGWGYDGVNLFAPTRLYGSPEDLCHFINKAHSVGIAVILDVVYNHLGPSGNSLHEFSPHYFSTKYKNDWGTGLNFDGENSAFVRNFYIQNALHWIKNFHFDGLRIDATQDIKDDSKKYILEEIIETCCEVVPHRELFFVAENEPQDSRFAKSKQEGGFGLNAAWNDDFHHTAIVSMTGRSEAYYTDYKGTPQEFISAAKYGFLFQGQRYDWQRNRRGSPTLDLGHHNFVHFLENHDQVANSGRGYRVHKITSAGRYRAMSAVLLLFPQIPMIFQGQEFASSKPFFYFADHGGELAGMISKGRTQFLAQFPSLATEEMSTLLPDPGNPQTFTRSKLDLSERQSHIETYDLYKDLLKIRREDRVIKNSKSIDGAVLGPEAFVLRYFGENEDRLLIVNLGRDLHLNPAPEPLLAPLHNKLWDIEWSSESPKYGGTGTAQPDGENNWSLPGHSAILLKPVEYPKSGE